MQLTAKNIIYTQHTCTFGTNIRYMNGLLWWLVECRDFTDAVKAKACRWSPAILQLHLMCFGQHFCQPDQHEEIASVAQISQCEGRTSKLLQPGKRIYSVILPFSMHPDPPGTLLFKLGPPVDKIKEGQRPQMSTMKRLKRLEDPTNRSLPPQPQDNEASSADDCIFFGNDGRNEGLIWNSRLPFKPRNIPSNFPLIFIEFWKLRLGGGCKVVSRNANTERPLLC